MECEPGPFGLIKPAKKLCPVCQQTFCNPALRFCRFDGNPLVNEQISVSDAPTVLLSTTPISERFGWLVSDAASPGDEQSPTHDPQQSS
jgi:hypothetical protein